MVVFFGHFHAFRKKLADYKEFNLVQSHDIFFFFIVPLFFQRRILLYDEKTKQYFEFEDDGLEKNLLKIEKGSNPKKYMEAIKEFERKKIIEFKELEKNKEKLIKKENKDFITFLKIVGIIISLLILTLILKTIFF